MNDVSSAQRPVEDYLDQWDLKRLGDGRPLYSTNSSDIYLVSRPHDKGRAILKHLSQSGRTDEARGAAMMEWYGDDAAAKMYEYDEGAQLMEYLDGPHLLDHHGIVGDDQSTEIIASIIMRLHGDRKTPPPEGLTPLKDRFRALHNQAQFDRRAVFARAAALAHDLAEDGSPSIPLHGDVHHENIVGTTGHAWKVIDPKGLLGPKEYDHSNVYCNPVGRPDITVSEQRIKNITRRFSDLTGHDETRLLKFGAVHAATSACWSLSDGKLRDANDRIAVAETIFAVLDHH
jgi:streptomycin 6-kinase